MKSMDMYRQVYTPINPFEKEACDRLLRKELTKQIIDNHNLKHHLFALEEENEELKTKLDAQKQRNDIPSPYPRPTFVIDKVIFNPPATIVFWLDGTKTVVKCKEGEEFSEWAGIALCLAKKLYGPNFHKIFKAHCSDPEKTANNGMHEVSRKAEYSFEEFLEEIGKLRKD